MLFNLEKLEAIVGKVQGEKARCIERENEGERERKCLGDTGWKGVAEKRESAGCRLYKAKGEKHDTREDFPNSTFNYE